MGDTGVDPAPDGDGGATNPAAERIERGSVSGGLGPVVAPEVAARVRRLAQHGVPPVEIARRMRLTPREIHAVLAPMPTTPVAEPPGTRARIPAGTRPEIALPRPRRGRPGVRRQRPRPPERSWREPEMRAALATHDLGTVFRILRQRGYSQRLVGEWAGLSQPEVSAISNHRPVRHYAVLARVAAGLGIPPGLMGLAWCDGDVCRSAVERGGGDEVDEPPPGHQVGDG